MAYNQVDWRIEILTADGKHFMYLPKFEDSMISQYDALDAVEASLDHSKFKARVYTPDSVTEK